MAEKMTRAQVIDFIINLKGAKPATIVTETVPKMNKFSRERDGNGNKIPNPFLGRIVKRTKMNVFLNVNYENSVNRQRVREQKENDFESQQRSWGTHLSPSIIVHNEQHYLQFKLERKYESEYINTTNGKRVELNDLVDYMPPRSKSKTQGTDKPILILTTKINGITHINTDGKEIEVERF